MKPAITRRERLRPRVALFGVFGGGNFGNEASLQAMVMQLRRQLPGVDLSCICTNPSQVAEDYGLMSLGVRTPELSIRHPLGKLIKRLATSIAWRLGWLHLGRIVRALWHTRGLDMLIFPGTGVLDDFATDPWMWPSDVLIWSAAAKVNGVKVVAVSIGAGPIRHPLSQRFMKTAARLWDHCSLRDESSRVFMSRLGMEYGRDRVYPDLVFGLPLGGADGNEAKGKTRQRTVGVGLMSYFGWKNDATQGGRIYEQYLEKISEFIVWLLERGCCVHLEIGEWCDREAVQDVLEIPAVAEAMRDGRVTAMPMSSIQELAQDMEGVDLVVATRFHNLVCALMLGKPAISLGYAEKNSELLREFGLEEYCQHVEEFDVGRLKVCLAEVESNLEMHRERILQKVTAYRDLLDHQYAALMQLIPVSGEAAGRQIPEEASQNGATGLRGEPLKEHAAIAGRLITKS